jgi:hypothetical protein
VLQPTCRSRRHVFTMLLTSVRHEESRREQKRNVSFGLHPHIAPFFHNGYEKHTFIIHYGSSVAVLLQNWNCRRIWNIVTRLSDYRRGLDWQLDLLHHTQFNALVFSIMVSVLNISIILCVLNNPRRIIPSIDYKVLGL